MTKTQLSVRLNPDTLAAIDAEAKRLGVSRGRVVDRWLSAQAGSADRVKQLTREAYEEIALGRVTLAVRNLAEAIDVLAGTAPEEE